MEKEANRAAGQVGSDHEGLCPGLMWRAGVGVTEARCGCSEAVGPHIELLADSLRFGLPAALPLVAESEQVFFPDPQRLWRGHMFFVCEA